MTTASNTICFATIAGNTARHAEPEYPWAAEALYALGDINRQISNGEFAPEGRERVSYYDVSDAPTQAQMWHIGYTCIDAQLGTAHYYVGECGELVVWCINGTRSGLAQQLNLAKRNLDLLIERPGLGPYSLCELKSLAQGFTRAIKSSRCTQA